MPLVWGAAVSHSPLMYRHLESWPVITRWLRGDVPQPAAAGQQVLLVDEDAIEQAIRAGEAELLAEPADDALLEARDALVERVGDLDAIADAVEAVDAIHPAMRDMEPSGDRCDFVEQVRGDYRVMQMGGAR